MGGAVSGWINTLTPCGWDASQRHWSGAGGYWRGPGWGSSGSSWRSWRGAWILTAVKTPSDTRLTHADSHTQPHAAHSCFWVLRHTPSHSQQCCRLNAFSFFFSPPKHICLHMQTQRRIHTIQRELFISSTQSSVIEPHMCRWSGKSIKRGSEKIF